MTDAGQALNGKKILVSGACGTIGNELVHQLLNHYSPAEVLCIDNNETELFFLEQRFKQFENARFLLVDVRDFNSLSMIMDGIDVVFHAAAFKHVTLCERSPYEAVQNNIIGVQNITRTAIENGVSKVVFTSSDKAVNPTNVMGTSKLMGERLVTAANAFQREHSTILVSTRFGNVMGSRGSVIPIFHEQIRQGKPITLTDNDMTRFVMSIKRAVQLVIDSAFHACGGEVFITKMPVLRIRDLAEVMVKAVAPMYGHSPDSIPIDVIGVKPGEKMYEELMTGEETRRAIELQEYFVVPPAFRGLYKDISFDYPKVVSDKVDNPYHSGNEPHMSHDEILDFLNEIDVLPQY
ncbi:polysaccharide biosynthesis protein [Desulfovibrio oxyclinae]|uniref:polysaccharide biosynthesis protein n=1 Tax=Desulfovibrio oxyclinae TaxID=63560 RepID=UPI00036C4E2D|nr:polysaccharide biosynthesis protein [Desulfovibrio oxyclinae]